MATPEYDDPIFGRLRLEQGSIWLGERNLEPFGDVRVRVDRADSSPPTDEQRDVFRHYEPRFVALMDKAIAAIRQHLTDVLRPIYAEVLDDEAMEEILPSDLDDAWVVSQLALPEIVVPAEPAASDRVPDIAVFWECNWDSEHGIAVWFKNFVVVNATQQAEMW